MKKYFDLCDIQEQGKERSPVYIGMGLLALTLAIIIDNLYSDIIFIMPYIPFIIMTGFLCRRVISLIFVSGLTIFKVYQLSPTIIFAEFDIFLFRWIVLFLVAFVIRLLVKNIQKERQLILQLTSSLAESIDARDKYTSFHSRNVAYYSKEIAKSMGISQKECLHIYIGGLLHDIGKIGVPEAILNKPERLTAEEFKQIQKHPEIGYNMLKHISFFRENSILDMVLHHHERFDGKGYPHGLKGENIPLVARIMAVADSFDAMTSVRIYRSNHHIEYALNEIRNNKGKQFDPTIAETLLDLIEKGQITIVNQLQANLQGDSDMEHV